MRHRAIFAICAVTLGLWVSLAPPAEAQVTRVRFVAPRHLQTILGPTEIELMLELPRGLSVVEVALRVDGKPLATLTSPPWTVQWDAGDGARGHHLDATVTLSDGTQSRSVIRTSPLRINQFEEVGLVNLYALVRDKNGDYVTDLDKDAFRVLEDGRPQRIRRFSTHRIPLRVAIVLDTSLTMEGRKLSKAKRAALDFLEELQPGDEGVVVTFSDSVRIAQNISADRAMLANAIETTTAGGGTALFDAVWRASRELTGFDGRRAIVLLSDGRDEARNGLEPGSLHTLAEALDEALHSEAMLFSIGLGRNLDYQLDFFRQQTVGDTLRELAQATGGRALISSGAGELRKAFRDVAMDLRNQYLISYVSDDEDADGAWREISVQLPGRELEIVTRRGYYAPVADDAN